MALDARVLKQHQRTFGGLYQSVLRSELTAKFGVGWEAIVNGQAEIAGLDPELLAAFSKRAAQVDVETDARLLPDFVAGQRTLLIAVGTVDAEVDFSRLGGEYVTVSADGKDVEVRLPPAELSETRLDFDRTHVVNRDRGIIDRLSEALSSNARDDQVLYQRASAQIEAAATRTQLRQRAEENTRLMLTSLLQGLGYEQVTVTFDAPTP